VPASQLSQVVGRPMSSTVSSGALLTASDVAPSTGPPSGRAVVGLALKPGQYPPGVAPGDRVLVVVNGSGSSPLSSTATGGSISDAPVEAIVVGEQTPPANSSVSLIVSVQLASGSGAAVASAASAGTVALAVISSGSP
jgi:hypothetical protein